MLIQFAAAAITWYFNRIEVKPTPSLVISTSDNKSSITIQNVSNENVGFYTCKAKNEVGEAVTLGKCEIASSQPAHTTVETSKSNVEIIETTKTKAMVRDIIETEELKIQREVYFSKEEITKESIESADISSLYDDPEITKLFKSVNLESYGPGIDTVKELTIIGYLMQQGSSIDDIKQIYNTNGFAALKQPESQFALVQLVEREGHGKLITDILVAEHIADDELVASTVGFLAFLKMIEMKHTTVENIISLLSREDFTRQEWKSIEVKEVQII